MFSKFLKIKEEDYEFYLIEIANIVSTSQIQIPNRRISNLSITRCFIYVYGICIVVISLLNYYRSSSYV